MTDSPFRVVGSLALAALALGSAAPCLAVAATPALTDVQQVYRTAGANEALRRVGVLIGQHPDDPALRFQQGVMLAEQHRSAEAIKVFQRLAHDFPDMPEAFNNLAVLYAEQGQIDKAGATLEQAMRTRPNYGTAFDNLRSTYNRMAGRAYAKALQIEETTPAAPKLALIQQLYEPPAATSANVATAAPVTLPHAPAPVAAPAVVAAASASPAPAPRPPAPPPGVVAAAAQVPSAVVAAVIAPKASAAASAPPASHPASAPAVAHPASAPARLAAASQPASAARPAPVAAARPPASAPVARASDDAQQIRAAVNDWARAWERKDMNAYFAAYSPGFKGTDANAAAWQTARRARILGKKRISVEISGISVSIDKGVARASFRQDYAADQLRFSNQKTLQLVEHNGKWFIDKEVAGT